MEHLVVDDVRDEVTWHPGAIEHGMDADQALEARVAPELDRAARRVVLPRRAPAPRDERVAGVVEVARVQVVEEREQVVVLALRVERDGACPASSEASAVRLDVVTDENARRAVVTRDVAHERVDHPGRRIQEHVVDAGVEDAVLQRV